MGYRGASSKMVFRVTIWASLGVVLLASSKAANGQSMPKLAAGVLKIIRAQPEEKDTVSGPRELFELSRATAPWQAAYSAESETLHKLSKELFFRRAIWQLEFAFKTVRMTTVNVEGRAKRIWYLVYRVTNTGAVIQPVAQKDDFGHDAYSLQPAPQTLRFFPRFVLHSHEFDRSYVDRVIPAAVRKIHAIEIRDPTVRLHDSVSITEVSLETSTDAITRSAWGVATWEDVDPRIDFFSIDVQGLTNAYRWEETAEEGRELFFKTVQLNFWRPGDAVHEHEKEFRYGLPRFDSSQAGGDLLKMYGLTERKDFTWVYRP